MTDTTTLIERIKGQEAAHTALVEQFRALRLREDANLGGTVATLRRWARQLNDWAEQSRTSGRSTHQVEANEALAAEIHRVADQVEGQRAALLAEMKAAEPEVSPGEVSDG